MKLINNKIVFEVGDWVTCIDNSGSAEYKVGNVGKVSVTEIGGSEDALRTQGHFHSMFFRRFRLSTQEEIDAATKEEKIMVGLYEVEFFESKVNIIIGCANVSKELFLKIGKRAGWL